MLGVTPKNGTQCYFGLQITYVTCYCRKFWGLQKRVVGWVSGPQGVLALSSCTFFWGRTSTQLRLQVLLHQLNVVFVQF
jgi:hypothetical protein